MNERLSVDTARTPRLVPSRMVDALLDDQSQRWDQGDRPWVELYLGRHPELHHRTEDLVDLIYHEIMLRSRHGEAPQLQEYLERFPHLGPQLRAQFEVHQAMELEAPVLSTRVDGGPPRAGGRGEIALPAPARLPGYEILEELGRGGMGVVYKAWQVGLKRLVAIKMIRPGTELDAALLTRFRREAEAVAHLHHPNIVQIYEVGEHEGQPYFSLELVNGGSLDKKLQGTPQPARQAAALLETLARAMHAAHERRIIHRDLKPANILLQTTEDTEHTEKSQNPNERSSVFSVSSVVGFTPKITDFGLAKHLGTDLAQSQRNTMVGTPNYMAPEQVCGKGAEVGPRTDVYSLGAILYEMLTGRPPFNAETVWDTLEQVVTQEAVPPTHLQPKVPRDLQTICLKCLEKQPARRYGSALAVAEDLHRFLHDEPIHARPASIWERACKWVKRRPTLTAVSASTLLLVFLLLGWHYVHLQLALTRQEWRAVLADGQAGFHQAEVSLNAHDWHTATVQVNALLSHLSTARAKFPDDPELAQLQAQAQQLHHHIQQRLTDQERLDKLWRYRDDVAFHATGFAGLDAASSLQETRTLVDAALHLFETGIDTGARPALAGAYFSPAQKDDISEGCFELLLELAQVTANVPTDKRGAATDALRILDRAALLGLTSPVYHERRARYLAQQGEEAAAQKERQHAHATPATRAFEWFLQGTDRYRDGRLAEAVHCFEKALRKQPDHFGARYALTVCSLKQRSSSPDLDRAHLAAARASLNDCINRQPRRVWPYLLRGYVHGELGEFEAAEADFAHVERTAAGQPTACYGVRVNRGVLRIRQGNLDGAVEDLQHAIRSKPTEFAAYVNLAEAYQRQHKPAEAAAQLDRAIALNPPRAVAAIYRTRARLHQQEGDLDAALHDLNQALQHEPAGRHSPAAADDFREIGRLWLRKKHYVAAVAALDDALKLQPDHPAAHRLRAEALLQLERYPEAIAALDRFLERPRTQQPGLATVYLARAEALTRVGKYAPAVDDYTQALALEPDNAAAHARRGWAFLTLEAPTLALPDFEKVLRLCPDNGEAFTGRGYARVKLGQYRLAVQDADEAVRRDAHTARLHYNAARIFAQAAGHVDRETVPSTPRSREVRRQYQDRSLALLRKAIDLQPSQQQKAFWRQTVAHDEAFNPVRGSAGFLDLARVWGASPGGKGLQ